MRLTVISSWPSSTATMTSPPEADYLPLLVFAQAQGEGEQELIGALLRPGNDARGA